MFSDGSATVGWDPARQARSMILLVLVLLAVFLLLDVLALTGRTPDTHMEVTQFGDYRF